MLEFRDILISDRDRVNSCLQRSNFMGCEYSFSNNLAWTRLGRSKITFYKDFYIPCCFISGKPEFILPSGDTSYSGYKEVFAEMKRYSDSQGVPLRVTGITKENIPMINEIFPGRAVISYDRDGSDYIYRTSDLTDLPGKKYHAKRNHLARFEETDCVFSLITDNDTDECILFTTKEYNERSEAGDYSFIAEQYAINAYFNYYHELGLTGGIIRRGGEIVALTIGEKLNSDTFCVHIEKADRSVNGIYAGINNAFAKAAASGCEYINREEDLGIEGLRRSKLSYHPVFLLDKYTAVIE